MQRFISIPYEATAPDIKVTRSSSLPSESPTTSSNRKQWAFMEDVKLVIVCVRYKHLLEDKNTKGSREFWDFIAVKLDDEYLVQRNSRQCKDRFNLLFVKALKKMTFILHEATTQIKEKWIKSMELKLITGPGDLSKLGLELAEWETHKLHYTLLGNFRLDPNDNIHLMNSRRRTDDFYVAVLDSILNMKTVPASFKKELENNNTQDASLGALFPEVETSEPPQIPVQIPVTPTSPIMHPDVLSKIRHDIDSIQQSITSLASQVQSLTMILETQQSSVQMSTPSMQMFQMYGLGIGNLSNELGFDVGHGDWATKGM